MNPPAFDRLLPVLVQAEVEFILVGGVAGVAHGAARLTAGRPKDFEAIAELEALLEEQ